MVSGRKAFEGASQASLISAIMKDEPRPMSALELFYLSDEGMMVISVETELTFTLGASEILLDIRVVHH